MFVSGMHTLGIPKRGIGVSVDECAGFQEHAPMIMETGRDATG
jgi:hypothetical protein